VGPPSYIGAAQKITDQYDTVAPQILGTAYHSSQSWVDDSYGRTSDLVHFTVAGGQQWASAITSWLSQQPNTNPLLWVAGAVAVVSTGFYVFFKRYARA
jgi:protein involved in temperature-dependent protein secretion